MRWHSFSGTLVFGGLAALGWLALAALGFATPLGLAGYLAALAVVYGAGLAKTLRLQLGVAAGLAVLAGALVFGATHVSQVALGLAFGLGLVRSGVLFRARRARALVIEAALLGGGLLLARALAPAGPAGVALALWTFFLVQALFFLVAGFEPQPREGGDRFERARQRLERALESEL